MVKPFSRSKRTPVRLRHKIEKASAAKRRKSRKEAKQNPQWKSRLKKDPGIPNLFPFKDKILAEIEEKRRLRSEANTRRKDLPKQTHDGAGDLTTEAAGAENSAGEMEALGEEMEGDEAEDEAGANPMAALLASAQARATLYQGNRDKNEMDEDSEDDQDGEAGGTPLPVLEGTSVNYKNAESSRRAFDRIFKQILEAADVILYVLDARDPQGTRSPEVEREILAADSGSKQLILVLNKIDLVPPPVLQAWLVHLRRCFPTIPLRASSPASNAHTFDHRQLTVKGTSETLLRTLKSTAASKQIKRSICVGVIGYPNVGKSSVINALTSCLNRGSQSSACPVGSEAGVTTSLREVKVDNKLKVLDSPGIVFPSESMPTDGPSRAADHEAKLILLNALPPRHISDPIPAVSLLLSRLSATPYLYEQLLENYSVTALGPFGNGDTTTDFLVQVARKRGRIGKGGVPNLSAAAMTVITDWRDGRIQGWMEAPILPVADGADPKVMGDGPGLSSTAPDTKKIVGEWADEFQLEGLWGPGGAVPGPNAEAAMSVE